MTSGNISRTLFDYLFSISNLELRANCCLKILQGKLSRTITVSDEMVDEIAAQSQLWDTTAKPSIIETERLRKITDILIKYCGKEATEGFRFSDDRCSSKLLSHVCCFVDEDSVEKDVLVICRAFKNCKLERSYFERLCHLAKAGSRLEKIQKLAEMIWTREKEIASRVVNSFIDWALYFYDKDNVGKEIFENVAAALQVIASLSARCDSKTRRAEWLKVKEDLLCKRAFMEAKEGGEDVISLVRRLVEEAGGIGGERKMDLVRKRLTRVFGREVRADEERRDERRPERSDSKSITPPSYITNNLSLVASLFAPLFALLIAVQGCPDVLRCCGRSVQGLGFTRR